jgi:hypothetical protein
MASRLAATAATALVAFTSGLASHAVLTAQAPLRPVPAADSRPYTDGTVWVMEFGRVKEGATDRLLNHYVGEWRSILELARGEGLILSYHVFQSMAATPRDWDVATMIELRNMAVLDVVNARLGDVTTSSGLRRPVDTLTDLREIVGTKLARSILLRPNR